MMKNEARFPLRDEITNHLLNGEQAFIRCGMIWLDFRCTQDDCNHSTLNDKAGQINAVLSRLPSRLLARGRRA